MRVSGTRSMNTTPMPRPTFSTVKSSMRLPPTALSRTDTIGVPPSVSKPDRAWIS